MTTYCVLGRQYSTYVGQLCVCVCVYFRFNFFPNPKDGSIYALSKEDQLEVFDYVAYYGTAAGIS